MNTYYYAKYGEAGYGGTAITAEDGEKELAQFEDWIDDQTEGSVGDKAIDNWLDYRHCEVVGREYNCIRKAYIDGYMRGFEMRLSGGKDD